MRTMSTAPSRTAPLRPYAPVDERIVKSLVVHMDRGESQTLTLRYVLTGNVQRLRIPPMKPQRRTDELWRHTCFEAFIRAQAGTAYHELNAAPSTEWALYSFDDYRQGMAPLAAARPPAITVQREAQSLIVEVTLDLKLLPPSRALALAAVIEDESGSLSYWALAHPGAKPDFHHPESFVLEI